MDANRHSYSILNLCFWLLKFTPHLYKRITSNYSYVYGQKHEFNNESNKWLVTILDT